MLLYFAGAWTSEIVCFQEANKQSKPTLQNQLKNPLALSLNETLRDTLLAVNPPLEREPRDPIDGKDFLLAWDPFIAPEPPADMDPPGAAADPLRGAADPPGAADPLSGAADPPGAADPLSGAADPPGAAADPPDRAADPPKNLCPCNLLALRKNRRMEKIDFLNINKRSHNL